MPDALDLVPSDEVKRVARAEIEKYRLAAQSERDIRITYQLREQNNHEARYRQPNTYDRAYWFTVPLVCLMLEFIVMMAFLWPK